MPDPGSATDVLTRLADPLGMPGGHGEQGTFGPERPKSTRTRLMGVPQSFTGQGAVENCGAHAVSWCLCGGTRGS